MKSLDIALKDIRQAFRSYFALAFMFVIPILVTTMFYFIFGGMGGGQESGFDLPRTPVVIVNLDVGSDEYAERMAGVLSGQAGSLPGTMGELIVMTLQSQGLEGLLEVTLGEHADQARRRVDEQQAAVAIILPENFTAAVFQPNVQAVVELYQDPTLSLGPAIVKAVMTQIIEQLTGTKIGVSVTLEQLGEAGLSVDMSLAQDVAARFLAASAAAPADSGENPLLEVRQPARGSAPPTTLVNRILQTVLGGMMVFYAFFTGVSTCQSILKENENGTLPRLIATPTTTREFLSGKFLSASLIVLVQIVVLMLFGRLVFSIQWGDLGVVLLFILGTVAMSASLGLALVAFLKTTRQAGAVFGGVMTITGMLGIINVFTMGAPSTPASLQTASLFVPQGWAMRSLLLAIEGVPFSQFLPYLAGMAAWSVVLFGVGNWRLRRRFG